MNLIEHSNWQARTSHHLQFWSKAAHECCRPLVYIRWGAFWSRGKFLASGFSHPGSIPGRCTWHRRSLAAWNSVRVPVSTWSTADMLLSPQPTNRPTNRTYIRSKETIFGWFYSSTSSIAEEIRPIKTVFPTNAGTSCRQFLQI